MLFFASVLIAVGIAWPNHLASCIAMNLSSSLPQSYRRARLFYEASARTQVVPDVDGWKYHFTV